MKQELDLDQLDQVVGGSASTAPMGLGGSSSTTSPQPRTSYADPMQSLAFCGTPMPAEPASTPMPGCTPTGMGCSPIEDADPAVDHDAASVAEESPQDEVTPSFHTTPSFHAAPDHGISIHEDLVALTIDDAGPQGLGGNR